MAIDAEDLFVLSDVTQMELFLSRSGKITGKAKIAVEIEGIGLKINLAPEIVSSRVDDNMIGLIIKVQGELFTAVFHDRKLQKIGVFVLNQGKMADTLTGFFDNNSKTGILPLIGVLRRACVVESSRDEYGTFWTPRLKAA